MDVTLTLQDDAFDRAEELAAELRIEEPAALGHLAYLWRWATRVLKPKHNAAPDGIVRGRAAVIRIEAAARWKGIRGAFVAALERMQLIARALKKIRVKGTAPYAEEWKKREAARVRERERRAAKRAEMQKMVSATTPPRLVSISKNDGVDEHGNPRADHPLGLWTWMMRARSDGRGVAPDREPPSEFETWHARLKREEISDYELSAAWNSYLRDQHFRERAWPVAVFMTEGVYRPRLTQTVA